MASRTMLGIILSPCGLAEDQQDSFSIEHSCNPALPTSQACHESPHASQKCGWHLFNCAHKMSFVNIVRQSSSTALCDVVDPIWK